jgi:2-polyprenyl-3-methyl-5-hydroxy-6-metoxy-1,4-benzoquinol methylase
MKSRRLVPELMDDPAIDPCEHRRALNGLRRVNRLCQTGKQVAREILSIAKKHNRKSISVLDIGCGSGDVATEVAERLAGQIECKVAGWDISQTAVECANQSWERACNRRNSQQQLSVGVHFEQADVFLPTDRKFDIVYCCLFLHHFSEDQAVQVLERMKEVALLSVLVDDLKRSRWGYAMAKVGCHLLSRSPVVHFDGPQSVRAAFTVHEARELAQRAGLEPCAVRHHWPERYLLRWER